MEGGKAKRIELVAEEGGKRVDTYLSERLYPNLSRSRIQQLIEKGNITLNGKNVKPSYRLKGGELIEIVIPPPPPQEILPEPIPLRILFEDEYLAVVEKPFGMLTHPVGNKRSGTLVNALLYHMSLSSIGAPLRPGIVHRLDRDTGGLLIVAKTDPAHHKLAKMIRDKEVDRRYIVLVHKEVDFEERIVDVPLVRVPHTDRVVVRKGGKEARTLLKRLKTFSGFSLLEAKLFTGRTHQIRVHCAYIGHPVVGDPLYAPRSAYSKEMVQLLKELNGQALYAYFIAFRHPFKGDYLSITSSLPIAFENLLKYIESI
ncbi:RluA family pseudouridine synthase [bacterium]|nr:RluA family pseudouridine synthase [bacterium]